MDLDDLDDIGFGDAPSKPAQRPSRFLPKSAKLKQPKTELQPQPQPKPDLNSFNKQEDDTPNPQVEPSIYATLNAILEETKPDKTMLKVEEEAEEESNEDLMDVDNVAEEDQVIREIDVYFTPPPLDTNAQLYVMQYPLRPSWRPYELDERCKEVRVKPKTGKVEIDLMLDTSSNYDNDADDSLRIVKQTLSSWKPPLTTSYAVGILVGNKLHLNPVHSVLQLRPSMEHLTSGRSKKNSATQNVESTSKKHGKIGESSIGHVTESEESWISLNYHGMDSSESSLSTRYRQKMTSQESSKIQFSMSPCEYINSLCPGSSTENDGSRRLQNLKRSVLSLPLNERFKKWLSEGPQLNRFSTLKHLAPDDPDEVVLDILQSYACVVQGLWISRTSLFQQLRPGERIARDYLLLLFKENIVVNRRQLEEYGLYREAEPYLKELAVYRQSSKDWNLKEPRDLSFINCYKGIVEEQNKKLEALNKSLMVMLNKRKNGPVKNDPSSVNSITKSSVNTDQGAKTLVNGTSGSKPIAIPDLSKSMEEVLRKHNVCSLQCICQGLQELGVLKANTSPPPEIHSVIDQVAIKIREVYVLKLLGDPTLDPLRRVVIDLLGAKEPNAKLKKADIVEAAKIQLKRDINNKEYTQVMSQLCVSVKGNAWVLKSGDGNTKVNNIAGQNVSDSQ